MPGLFVVILLFSQVFVYFVLVFLFLYAVSTSASFVVVMISQILQFVLIDFSVSSFLSFLNQLFSCFLCLYFVSSHISSSFILFYLTIYHTWFVGVLTFPKFGSLSHFAASLCTLCMLDLS